MSVSDPFALEYHPESYRRVIAGEEVILHCHHYNSRLQRTLEGAEGVNGKGIIRDSASHVFERQVNTAASSSDPAERLTTAARLYGHLGFGKVDFSELDQGKVSSTSAHFVEGWHAGFKGKAECVCTFTEGFLQGAIQAATGRSVQVRETQCMMGGHTHCSFEVEDSKRSTPQFPKFTLSFSQEPRSGFQGSDSVDEATIIGALVAMPIHGDPDGPGLIPAFGVYLANMPADFYNLACHTFVQRMTAQGKLQTARELLIADAESCAMNTFRGIMNSPEWEGLVGPMIKQRSDKLFGLIAVSNALGWGNWHVAEHTPSESLELVSLNGYEALGYRELFREGAGAPMCFMLAGVSAGIMELLYSYGSIEERFGTFLGDEEDCICTGNTHCSFLVEAA